MIATPAKPASMPPERERTDVTKIQNAPRLAVDEVGRGSMKDDLTNHSGGVATGCYRRIPEGKLIRFS